MLGLWGGKIITGLKTSLSASAQPGGISVSLPALQPSVRTVALGKNLISKLYNI